MCICIGEFEFGAFTTVLVIRMVIFGIEFVLFIFKRFNFCLFDVKVISEMFRELILDIFWNFVFIVDVKFFIERRT